MTEQAIGYLSSHIGSALNLLDSRYHPAKSFARSSDTIRRHAKEHDLFVEYKTRSGQRRLLIPERNLEKLIKVLGLVIKVDDLYEALTK